MDGEDEGKQLREEQEQRSRTTRLIRTTFLFILDLVLLLTAVPRGSKLSIRVVFLMLCRMIIYGGVLTAQYALYATLQVDRKIMEPTGLTMSVENLLGLPENCPARRGKRETTGWDQLVKSLSQVESAQNDGRENTKMNETAVKLELPKIAAKEEFPLEMNQTNWDFEDIEESNNTFADFDYDVEEPEVVKQVHPKLSLTEEESLKEDPNNDLYKTLTKPNPDEIVQEEVVDEEEIKAKDSRKVKRNKRKGSKAALGIFTETDVKALGLVFGTGVALLAMLMICSAIVAAEAQDRRVAAARRELMVIQEAARGDFAVQTTEM